MSLRDLMSEARILRDELEHDGEVVRDYSLLTQQQLFWLRGLMQRAQELSGWEALIRAMTDEELEDLELCLRIAERQPIPDWMNEPQPARPRCWEIPQQTPNAGEPGRSIQ